MRNQANGTRAILAASVGNLLEWYDFSVYALFAIYIGQNFFPRGDPGIDLVKAFLVFGLGFVIRPLGAVLIGIYGDRAGRKAALTLTILIMAGGTLIIAAAPSYAAIGIGAPLLLLTGRVLQGFSAGGEIGSATAFLVEHAPTNERGRYTAWLQGSMGMSNILGALVAFAVTTLLPAAHVAAWGWRIPFFIGLMILPVGVYLRKTLEETPQFRAELVQIHDRQHGAAPLITVFRQHFRSLLVGMGISILWAVAVYVLLIFMPVLAQKAFGFSAAQAFGSSLIGNVVFVGGCFAFGALADRIGHTRVLAIGAVLLMSGVLPLFLWLAASKSTVTLVIVLSAFGVMVSSFTSVAPTALSSLFPTHVRATGVSIVYNAAITIFGGFAPAILTWLGANAGSVFAPAWYVVFAGLPAIAAIPFLRGAAHANEADAKRGLDRETLRSLSRRSTVRGVLQLMAHAALLGATGFCVWLTRGSALIVPAVVLHGIVLNFLFCPLHETTHWSAFAGRRWNEAVGWVCGFLLLLPPQFFRQFHFAHHRHTQDPTRDPELALPAPRTLRTYLWRVSGLPNWHRRLSVTLRHALTGRVSEPFIPVRMHAAIVREARLVWGGYVLVFIASVVLRRSDALLYWLLPLLAGQPFLRLFLLAEHTGCALGGTPFNNTRTTYTNAAVRLLSWRMCFHVEHHCFPSIPFHALARVNALICHRIEVAAPGYVAVHRGLLRQFRSGPAP